MEKSRHHSHVSQSLKTQFVNLNKELEKIKDLHGSLVFEIKEKTQNVPKWPSVKPSGILHDLSETTSQLIGTRNTNTLSNRQQPPRQRLMTDKKELNKLSPVESIDEDVQASCTLKVSFLQEIGAPVRVDQMKSSLVLYKNISSMAVANPLASHQSNILSDLSLFNSKRRNLTRALPSTNNTIVNTDRSLSIYKLFYDEVESKRQTRTLSTNSHLFSNPSGVISSRLHNRNPPNLPARTSIDRNVGSKAKIPRLPFLPPMNHFGLSNSSNQSVELKNHPMSLSTPKGKASYLPTNGYINLADYPLYRQANNLFLLKACSLFNKSMIFENEHLRVFCQTQQENKPEGIEISLILTYSSKITGVLLSAKLEPNSDFKVLPKAYSHKSLASDLRQTVTFVVPHEPVIIYFPSLKLGIRVRNKDHEFRIPLPFSINKFARQITPTNDFVIRYLDYVR